MHDATLCFLVQDHPPTAILLGFKKIGFGAGKYTGFGGKVEAHETVLAAAVREMEEETGVRVLETDLQPVAHLTFRFPARPDWSQTVHVFFAAAWDGAPVESIEMKPYWFHVDTIPYQQMWQDGTLWLPRILSGEIIEATFSFRDDNETVDKAAIAAWDGRP